MTPVFTSSQDLNHSRFHIISNPGPGLFLGPDIITTAKCAFKCLFNKFDWGFCSFCLTIAYYIDLMRYKSKFFVCLIIVLVLLLLLSALHVR